MAHPHAQAGARHPRLRQRVPSVSNVCVKMETDTPHDQEDPHSQADEGHLQDGAGGQGPGAVHMIDRRKTLALCKMIDRHMWQSPLTLTALLPFELEII